MSDPPDLAALWPLAAVAALPAEALPAAVAYLAALQAAVAARLVGEPLVQGPDQGDRLLTVEEAAVKLATEEDWLRRHAPTLPFTVKLSPGQLRFSLLGIEAYIRANRGR